MLDSTIELIRAGLKTDPTLSSDERARLLVVIRNHDKQTQPPQPACQDVAPKIIRRNRQRKGSTAVYDSLTNSPDRAF